MLPGGDYGMAKSEACHSLFPTQSHDREPGAEGSLKRFQAHVMGKLALKKAV